jgi:hypothetical protein
LGLLRIGSNCRAFSGRDLCPIFGGILPFLLDDVLSRQGSVANLHRLQTACSRLLNEGIKAAERIIEMLGKMT